MAEGDPLEIFVDGENVVLRKYQPMCCFCENGDEIEEFRGKKICKDCGTEIRGRPVKDGSVARTG